MSKQGCKHDGGKLRYDLVPVMALEEVTKVITLGAEKYDPENWKHVPEGRRRYTAAAFRHIEAWRKGETTDEIGTHHIANAISNLMFILEKELRGWEDVKESSQQARKDLSSPAPMDNEHYRQDCWYPDDSGEWVETSSIDFNAAKAFLKGRYLEVLTEYERCGERYRKTVMSFESWFDSSDLCWGNRVAYKIVE